MGFIALYATTCWLTMDQKAPKLNKACENQTLKIAKKSGTRGCQMLVNSRQEGSRCLPCYSFAQKDEGLHKFIVRGIKAMFHSLISYPFPHKNYKKYFLSHEYFLAYFN